MLLFLVEFVVVVVLNVDSAVGGGCTGVTKNEKCLTRSQVGKLAQGDRMVGYMDNDDDVCFSFRDKQVGLRPDETESRQ